MSKEPPWIRMQVAEDGKPSHYTLELARKMFGCMPKRLFSDRVDVVPVRILIRRFESHVGGSNELTIIHDSGFPGSLTICADVTNYNIGPLNPKVQAVLRRDDGRDYYYDVLVRRRDQLNLQDGTVLVEDDLSEIDDQELFDTVDSVRYTPVKLPDCGGTEGPLLLHDGIDLLTRKMHHQINRGKLEPRRWSDVLFDKRGGKLDTTGMEESRL